MSQESMGLIGALKTAMEGTIAAFTSIALVVNSRIALYKSRNGGKALLEVQRASW